MPHNGVRPRPCGPVRNQCVLPAKQKDGFEINVVLLAVEIPLPLIPFKDHRLASLSIYVHDTAHFPPGGHVVLRLPGFRHLSTPLGEETKGKPLPA